MLPFGLLTLDWAWVNVKIYHSESELHLAHPAVVSHPTVNCDNMNDLSHTELYLNTLGFLLSVYPFMCILCLYRRVFCYVYEYMVDVRFRCQLFWFSVLVNMWQIWHFDVMWEFYLHEVLHFSLHFHVFLFLRAGETHRMCFTHYIPITCLKINVSKWGFPVLRKPFKV